MSFLNRFLANAFWTVFGKVCVQLILFAVSIAITRYLGSERLGVYATLLVIPAFVRLLNQLGLETLINQKLPQLNVNDPTGRQGRFLVRRLFVLRFFSSVLFCGLIYFVLPLYLEFIQRPDLLAYRWVLVIYFFVITLDSLFSTLFMTLLKYRLIMLVETAGALCNLGLLVLFIVQDKGIEGVLWAYVLSVLVTLSIYGTLALRQFKGETEPVAWGGMKHLAWVSYGISLLSFGLLTQSDVLMMNYFQIADADIGYYHLAHGLALMAAFVLTGFGPLALSLFSETFARESHAGLARIWCEIVGFSAFLTLPIYVFVFFNAEALIRFVYGAPFTGAAGILALFSLLLGASVALGSNYTVSTLFVLEKRNTAMRSTIEGSVLNVALNLLLIPRFGVWGATLATGSVMLYMVIRQLASIQASIRILPVFAVMGKCLCLSVAAALPLLLTDAWFGGQLIVNAVVYIASFLLLMAWSKPISEEHRRVIADLYPRAGGWVRCFVRGA